MPKIDFNSEIMQCSTSLKNSPRKVLGHESGPVFDGSHTFDTTNGMKNKTIFITPNNVLLTDTGGNVCSKRNYESVCDILGAKNVDLVYLNERKLAKNFRDIFKNNRERFHLYLMGLTKSKLQEIVNTVLVSDYDYVFLDTSLYGKIAKRIKKEHFKGKIISFFHNVEYDFFRSQNILQKYFPLLFLYPIYKAEYLTSKYSDTKIALNERDAKRIQKRYHATVDLLIPISMKDSCCINYEQDEIASSQPTGLFIGSNFWGNTKGIKWFIKNVLPLVDIKLIVIGKDMKLSLGKYIEKMCPSKLEVLDFVQNTTPHIKNADFMLMPIFEGSGMKVKTCEALMHGKYIIGTREAFEGYDINENIASICNNKEEFITAIKDISVWGKSKKENTFARKLYMTTYSYEKTLTLFVKLFKQNAYTF